MALNITKLLETLDRAYGEVQKVKELDDDTLTDEWKKKNWKRLKYVLLVNYCGINDVQTVGRTLAKLYPKLKFRVKQSKKLYKVDVPNLGCDYHAPIIILTFEGPIDVVDKVHVALRNGFGTGANDWDSESGAKQQNKTVQAKILSEYRNLDNKKRAERDKAQAVQERLDRLEKLRKAVTQERSVFQRAALEHRAERLAKANAIREGVRKRHTDFLASRRRVQTA